MWAFIKKEFYHIFRDYRSMIILFGIPVVQVLLFGFAITNDIRDAKIAVLDASHDEVTRKITDKMVASNYFLLAEEIESGNFIEDAFRKGEIKEVVVFAPDFARSLQRERNARIQLVLDASEPNTANMLNAYSQAIINDYIMQNMGGEAAPKGIVEVQPMMLFNPELKSVYMFVPGVIALLLMLVSAMMTSISITREKELGTMEALLVSPLRPIQIILGKVTPYVILSLINLVTILILGTFVFGMPIKGSLVLLMAESLLFIVMALALGILISTVSKTQQQAMMLSMFALMLPTILLSGFIFPIENMPAPLQYLSLIMPPRWFIVILKNIMLKGVNIAYFWKETLIIALMMVFFITMSVKKFKIRLE